LDALRGVRGLRHLPGGLNLLLFFVEGGVDDGREWLAVPSQALRFIESDAVALGLVAGKVGVGLSKF
jgi:hypothetical protein